MLIRIIHASLVLLVAVTMTYQSSSLIAAVQDVADHETIEAGEHPRLIFRGQDELKKLQAAGKSNPFGERVVYRLQQTIRIMERAPVTGRNQEIVREAGYRATGHAAVHLYLEDKEAAEKARQIILNEVIGYPVRNRLTTMDRAAQLIGTAMAYDLAYHAWDANTRERVQKYMTEETQWMIEKAGGFKIEKSESPDQIVALAAAGIAEMALLHDVESNDASKRLKNIEKAIATYLDTAVMDQGLGRYGESIKQAAFASGILPYAHASRLVMGRDFSDHPALQHALTPMIYQAVPEVGMPVLGTATAQVDRSGMFALAGGFIPENKKPAARWMLQQLGGDAYAGVVRPHHALYMLGSGLVDLEPTAPDQNWDRLWKNDAANFFLLRSRFKDKNDLVLVTQNGSVRLLGYGQHWLSQPGIHAHLYSHSRGAGAIDNRFHVQTSIGRTFTHRSQVDYRLTETDVNAEQNQATVIYAFTGEVNRTRESITVNRTVDGKRVKEEIAIPEGGKFSGKRIIGIDLSEGSDYIALLAFADTIEGGGEVPRELSFHLSTKHEVKDTPSGQFAFTGKQASLLGQIISPAVAKLDNSSNPPFANFVSLTTEQNTVHSLIVIYTGETPPTIVSGEKGFSSGVKIGQTTVKLDGERFIFE